MIEFPCLYIVFLFLPPLLPIALKLARLSLFIFCDFDIEKCLLIPRAGPAAFKRTCFKWSRSLQYSSFHVIQWDYHEFKQDKHECLAAWHPSKSSGFQSSCPVDKPQMGCGQAHGLPRFACWYIHSLTPYPIRVTGNALTWGQSSWALSMTEAILKILSWTDLFIPIKWNTC